MRRWPSYIVGSWALWTCYGSAQAFTYEVIFDETLGRESVKLGRARMLASSLKSVLLDGQVETTGTDTVTYDRILINSLRVMQQIPFTPTLTGRLTLPIVGTFEKQEGKQVPRKISEASWFEAKPKVELVYATQNSLDLILGLNLHTIGAISNKTNAASFTAEDHYRPVSMNYPHLVIVKHGSNFDGGFAFQKSAEKTRTVTKTTSLDESALVSEDKVYNPTTISIFANFKQNFGELYGEFAAVEASGGGNLTESGASVREDYFRAQFTGLFPLGGKSLQLETSLLYKSLSYADNRNVSLDTIPMLGLHLKLRVDTGIPFYAGIIGVRGTDGQSLQEFNANYRIVGFGGCLGADLNF